MAATEIISARGFSEWLLKNYARVLTAKEWEFAVAWLSGSAGADCNPRYFSNVRRGRILPFLEEFASGQ